MKNIQIPIRSIIQELDAYLNREDYENANRLLHHWKDEARRVGDHAGELSILSEIMGFSRRIQDQESGISAVWRGFELIEKLNLKGPSAGTIYLNGATTLKAFGQAAKGIHYYEKAGEHYRQSIPKEDPLWGGYYNNYGLALADVKRFDEALDCYQKAINIMAKKENGVLEIAVTLMNIAELYEQMGECDALIHCALDQALECLNETTLDQNGYCAFVCRKCAPTFGHYGRGDVERELNERADKIYERN